METAAQVLDELIGIATASEQDTTWTSRWDTEQDMVRELRDHAERLRARRPLGAGGELALLFLPTGPLQEVAISSGWGERFLTLAERFDRARQRERGGPPDPGRNTSGPHR